MQGCVKTSFERTGKTTGRQLGHMKQYTRIIHLQLSALVPGTLRTHPPTCTMKLQLRKAHCNALSPRLRPEQKDINAKTLRSSPTLRLYVYVI